MTKPWVEREIERLAHKYGSRRRLVRKSALLITLPAFLPALALSGIGWCLQKFGRGALWLGSALMIPHLKVPEYVETLAGYGATLDRFRRVMGRFRKRRNRLARSRAPLANRPGFGETITKDQDQ